MKKDVAASAAGADKNEIVVYQPEGGEFHIEVRVENESVWLNRQQMAILFGKDVKTIGKHIANALKEELKDIPTVANFATVQNEGGRDVRRNVEHYNLDVIISVGYRVKSANGVKFRQWANQVLRDHLLRGYSINHRMLAMGGTEISLFKQNVDMRLTAVEQRVDFFVNTAHNVQNQKIEQLSHDVQKVKIFTPMLKFFHQSQGFRGKSRLFLQSGRCGVSPLEGVAKNAARRLQRGGAFPPHQKYNTRYTIAQTYINVGYKKTPVT